MYTVPNGLMGLVLDPAQNPKHFVQKFGHLFNFGFLPSTISFKQGGSVADPECLSRILIFTHPGSRIPDPGSRIPDLGSRIPDPKTATKERGKKN